MSPLSLLLLWMLNIAHGDVTKTNEEDFDFFPMYTYRYNVYDPLTDDMKSQQETRNGDVVKGYYAVKDADGFLREVHYTADEKHGFRVVIKKNGKLQYFPGPAPT